MGVLKWGRVSGVQPYQRGSPQRIIEYIAFYNIIIMAFGNRMFIMHDPSRSIGMTQIQGPVQAYLGCEGWGRHLALADTPPLPYLPWKQR